MKNIITILLVTCLLSCKKDQSSIINESINSKGSDKNNFSLRLGNTTILKFKSEAALNDTLELLLRKDSVALDDWENQRGFISMRRLFDEIGIAELKIADEE